MGRFRFSITTLLVVITLLAAGLAAFVSQSRFGASAAYTGYVSLLCLATAGAIVVKTGGRTFWIGFALFGWLYWGTEFETTREAQTFAVRSFRSWSPLPQSVDRPPLVTDDFLRLLEQKTAAKLQLGASVNAQWTNGAYYPGTIIGINPAGDCLIDWSDGSNPTWVNATLIRAGGEHLHATGHALLGSLFGLFGGGLAFVLFGNKTP